MSQNGYGFSIETVSLWEQTVRTVLLMCNPPIHPEITISLDVVGSTEQRWVDCKRESYRGGRSDWQPVCVRWNKGRGQIGVNMWTWGQET